MSNNTNFEYYTILPIIKENTPSLMNDFEMNEEGIDFLYMAKPAPEKHIAYLQFSELNPNPDLDVDYFDLDSAGVYSKRIKDVLEKIMPIKFFEFVPVIIEDDDGEEINDFYIANIYQEIDCFDPKLSQYRGTTDTGRWEGIEKAIINKEILSTIPLEERLVLVSHEGPQFHLYHKSIVDVNGT